jgi:hypothetical protein
MELRITQRTIPYTCANAVIIGNKLQIFKVNILGFSLNIFHKVLEFMCHFRNIECSTISFTRRT